MIQYTHLVEGDEVTINRVENYEDLEDFRNFIRQNINILASDSETTGLDMYSDDFGVRLVQFGNPMEAYVVPVELGGQFVEDVTRALRGIQHLIFQNGGFDLQVFDRHLGVRMEDLWPRISDTKILAHLVEPRNGSEGGIDKGLDPLTAGLIDSEVAENVKGLMTKLAKEYKTTKAKIWSTIDLDHPEYNLYAGMDTILAARLYRKLIPRIPESSKQPFTVGNRTFSGLVEFEHHVAEICSYMERTGYLLDVEYSERLSQKLVEEEEYYKEVARSYGCENVNSTTQLADALEDMGVRITGRTEKGNRKVDKNVLKELSEGGNELATATIKAKKAGKWRKTWVSTFLNDRDSEDRCHPNIRSLQARTARMSITGIPAQTLPASDWMIRRCFVSDPGHFTGSIDYKTQELRVLAALAGEEKMMEVFKKEDGNLHLATARAAFGDHVQKDTKEYKAGKGTNFAVVFGGTWRAVHEQFGVDKDAAKTAVETFWNTYPSVKRYAERLQREAKAKGYITTPIGRRLPVDPNRAYSALNYMVQSTSRDVTCRGLVRLHQAGFTPYLRLPIHDEVVVSIPQEHAEWGVKRIGELMSERFGPVDILTDPSVSGKSWGHEYMKDKNDNPDTELIAQADKEIKEAGLW
ncbi:DNA polymerase [Actinopolyspora erythraea]|uniref:DNA polymerase I n=1 Tax=Actinopolyspora erythraea TaxID=414996 RepID=A0A223RRQ0_9ACTN|nr:DNA polymerase [Actinopolyspora erythraea]ASU78514.1 DNA polymerase [Actinopolyspora erythraea]